MGAKTLELLNLILPILWSTAGPALVVMLTATANNLAKLYIPRAIQIPLAGVLGAIVAGLTGDGESMNATAVGLANGLAVQSALSMPANKFLAGPPEVKP